MVAVAKHVCVYGSACSACMRHVSCGLTVVCLLCALQMMVAFTRAVNDAAVFVEDKKPGFKEVLETSTAELMTDMQVCFFHLPTCAHKCVGRSDSMRASANLSCTWTSF